MTDENGGTSCDRGLGGQGEVLWEVANEGGGDLALQAEE